MNNWNFNEVTQADILDFKACQRTDGSIYGVPDKSECQTGKEIKVEDLQKLAIASNKGDAKAKQQLKDIEKVEKEQKDKGRAEKKKADQEKKKAAAEGKGKGKGKKGGGKAKKSGGGGKGKGSKSKGGGGAAKSAASAPKRTPQTRQSQIESARKGVKALQDALSTIKNPKQRARIEEKIADLLTQVAQLSMPSSLAQQAQQQPQAPGNQQQQQQQQQKPEKS